MAIYRLPPSPFLGGRQPLEPRKLTPSELDVAVNDPPFGQRTWLAGLLRAWQPGPPQPQAPWKLSPSIIAVAEDDPPFGQRLWASAVLQAWQPGPPAAIRARFVIPPAEVEVLLTTRPWLLAILRSWQIEPPRPWFGWDVHPSIEAVAEDQPPFGLRSWLSTVLVAGQPGPPPPQRHLPVVVQEGPAPAVGGGDELTRLGTEPGAVSGANPVLGGWMT